MQRRAFAIMAVLVFLCLPETASAQFSTVDTHHFQCTDELHVHSTATADLNKQAAWSQALTDHGSIQLLEMEPLVQRRGEDDFTLYAIVDENVEEVRLTISHLQQNGDDVTEVVLRRPENDDSGNGDDGNGEIAVNEHGSNDTPRLEASGLSFDWDIVTQYDGAAFGTVSIPIEQYSVVLDDESETTSDDELTLVLRFIDPYQVPVPKAQSLNDDVQHTSYVVNLIADASFPDYEIDARDVAQDFYGLFPNDRDFLFVNDMFISPSGASGQYLPVRNNIQGIGLNQFNNSGQYGSSALQGVIRMHRGIASPGFVTHQLLHRWAAYGPDELDLIFQTHWEVAEFPSSGFGTAFTFGAYDEIEDAGNGTYHAYRHGEPDYSLNTYELYLAGFIAAAEVEPFRTLVNPSFQETVQENGAVYDIYTADDIREITIEDIVEVLGERSPAGGEVESAIATAMVTVSTHPMTETDLAFFEFFMREYEAEDSDAMPATWRQATGGHSSLSACVANCDAVVPATPQLTSPAHEATEQEADLTLEWSAAEGASAYHVQVADNEAFRDPVVDEPGLDETTYAASLQDGVTYYWRVRGENDNGWSAWGGAQSFTVGVGVFAEGPGSDIPAQIYLAQNYPNPFNPSTSIQYGLPATSNVRVELFNPLGQRVAVLVDEMQAAGVHELTFEINDLPSGVYIYRLQAGDVVKTRTLTYLR